MNRWKYALNGLQNAYHVSEWPLYSDWIKACKVGSMREMTSFYNSWIKDVNDRLAVESFFAQVPAKPADQVVLKPMEFYDSGWRTIVKIDYDPHERVLTSSAREIVGDGGPVEAMVWFSKNPTVRRDQIIWAINTLLITRKLKEARLALALFSDLPFREAAENKECECDIFRTALMTGDLPIIHELWVRHAFHGERVIELCDLALKKGWYTKDVEVWYREHRDKSPKQRITDKYEYLEKIPPNRRDSVCEQKQELK